MQIVVRQISGLGNQLFQYAAGRFYADRLGASLRILIDPPESAVSHGSPRPFLLPNFAVDAPLRPPDVLDLLALPGSRLLRPVSLAVRTAMGVRRVQEVFTRRYGFLPPEELPRARTLYLVGYWQNYRTVEGAAEALRRELRLREPAAGRNLDYLRVIDATPNAVSLHIRRGDYTLAAEGNIALPLDYYRRAIAEAERRFDRPHFFIFSDDLPWARAHLPRQADQSSADRFTFVEGNDAFSAHEDLRLMSACRHHIMANSTFSWWGAWLNPRPDKLVLAPRHWLLTPESSFPDLMPPDWILLDSLRDSSRDGNTAEASA